MLESLQACSHVSAQHWSSRGTLDFCCQVVLHATLGKFEGVSVEAVSSLWRAFIETAPCFAVTEQELTTLLTVLVQEVSGHLNATDATSAAASWAADLFTLWSQNVPPQSDRLLTDCNGLTCIDALEVIMAVLFVSKMTLEEKLSFAIRILQRELVHFIFNCLDLDGNNMLDLEEFTIGFKSVEGGLAKARGAAPLDDQSLMSLATSWFESMAHNEVYISRSTFKEFAMGEAGTARLVLDAFAQPNAHTKGRASTSDTSSSIVLSGTTAPSPGDEFMAVKPWLGAIVAPSQVPAPVSLAPGQGLVLEWVHGYRGQTSGNALQYLSRNQIVYPAAAVGVVFDVEARKQQFWTAHKDDVLCIAVSPSKKLVATGEQAAKPKICVWNPDTLSAVITLVGFHKRGVTALAFTCDGAKLVSVGLDDSNSIAIYGLLQNSAGILLTTSRGNQSMLHDLRCSPYSPHAFAVCRVRHMDLWNMEGGGGVLKWQQAVLRSNAAETFLCGAWTSPQHSVFGTATGQLIQFKGNEAVTAGQGNAVQAHTERATALITGGRDGRVLGWQVLKGTVVVPALWEMDLYASGVLGTLVSRCDAGACSICLSADHARLLIGTLSCQAVEVAAPSTTADNKGTTVKIDVNTLPGRKVIINGHYKGELWGLAAHPSEGEYCTAGDDQTLRVWDVASKRQLCAANLGGAARACAYSPDGALVAVGMGGGGARGGSGKQRCDGAVKVFERSVNGGGQVALRLLHELRDAKQWISDIKFSPDGKTLAVGSHDNCVYLYSVEQQFQRRAKFAKHNSYITHIDFSEDSAHLRSNCGAYELLFSATDTGAQVTRAASLRDTRWATCTCTLGWPVQSIWPPCADGTDIDAVDRSHGRTLLATADDKGKVKLFRHPCVTTGAAFLQFSGHSSHVTNCRSVFQDTHLVSCGGNGHCILQWQLNQAAGVATMEQPSTAALLTMPGSPQPSAVDSDLHGGQLMVSTAAGVGQLPLHGGDEFMAVKPWVGAIVTPSAPKVDLATGATLAQLISACVTQQTELRVGTTSGTVSKEHGQRLQTMRAAVDAQLRGTETGAPRHNCLELEWVHGYRGHDCRNNAVYAADGTVVYHAATLGIVLARNAEGQSSQRFYQGHTNDILSLTLHPNGTLCATGQDGKVPSIQVWSLETLATAASLSGFHRRGVGALAFSDNGTMLASVGMDDDNSIALYNWRAHDGKPVANAKGERSKTLDICFKPGSTGEVITVGVKFIRSYSVQGQVLLGKKVSAGAGAASLTSTCVRYAGPDAVVGTSGGEVYVFSHIKHLELNSNAAGLAQLYAGGKGGVIAIWEIGTGIFAKSTRRTLMSSPLPGSAGSAVRSIYLSPDGSQLLVGTQDCELWEVPVTAAISTGNNTAAGLKDCEEPLVRGHHSGELWGLAAHPSEGEYCTAGDDQTLRVWDVASKRQLCAANLGGAARACAYSPDGALVAVGMGGGGARGGSGKQRCDGAVKVFERSVNGGGQVALRLLHELRDAKQWISDIKFSPDGKTLAVGSHDNCVYLYSVEQQFQRRAKFAKHNSYITHTDFSEDSAHLRSNCGAYELLFSATDTGAQVTRAASLRDTRWATCTCTLGWPVQGIWPPCADGTDINAVDRSHGGTLLATADDMGKVKLFQYPCVKSAEFLPYGGHSSHVTSCRFTAGDDCLITCGGNDKCIVQWRHIMSAPESEAEHTLNPGLLVESNDSSTGISGGGDMFMATRPWIAAIKAPSALMPEVSHAPAVGVELEWVHGFSCQGTRNSVHYTVAGDIVYPAATLGVLLGTNSPSCSQRFLKGHTGKSLYCFSADKQYIATGQVGRRPTVRVWDAARGVQLAVLEGQHSNGICALAFSPDGRRLATVGDDPSHCVAQYLDAGGAWSSVKLEAAGNGDKNRVLWAHWVEAAQPKGATSDTCDTMSLATGGVKHVTFWSRAGSELKGRKGVVGSSNVVQALPCAATLAAGTSSPMLVTGTSAGELMTWGSKNEVTRTVQAHAGAVLALCGIENGGLASGGKDGVVKLWSSSLGQLCELALAGIPGTVISNHAKRALVVGTQGCEIFEVVVEVSPAGAGHTLKAKLLHGGQPLTCGHGRGELWGLDMAPENPDLADLYVTAGDDATVRVWSMAERRLIAMATVGDAVR
ncbi:WD40-repeat-containing domain protein, partial [Tribonema minus]